MYLSLKHLLVLPVVICTANCTRSISSESENAHERSKRWLTFIPNGGSANIIMGVIVPLLGHSRIRRCGAGITLDALYQIPAAIIWPVPDSVFKERLRNGFVDNSRTELYRLLEKMFDGFGTNGRDCVLRAICEVAEAPLNHNGMFGELLDVVFTPHDDDQTDEAYKLAKVRGSAHMDCAALYKRCPVGSRLIEKLSILFGS